MRPPDDPEVAAWLRKADSDLRMARLAAGVDDPMWDQVCFHAQQAAEKYLKGLMVACELRVPRTHDLAALLDRLAPSAPGIEDLLDQAHALSQYGVAARYPSPLDPDTTDEGQRDLAHAIDSARRG